MRPQLHRAIRVPWTASPRRRPCDYGKIVVLLFLVAAGLRFSLAAVNGESNDDHFSVIRILMQEGRIPSKQDAWEGFQPKLFHLAAAAVMTPLTFAGPKMQVRAGQALNCIAGMVTLYAVYLFLSRLAVSRKSRLIGFAMVAFNPKLIGINAQLTNDSFVIMFSTLCFYFGSRFFIRWGARDLCLMTLFAIAAALSKGNALVLFPLIIATFFLTRLFPGNVSREPTRTAFWKSLSVFVIAFMLLVPFLGQYHQNYRRYGSPFVVNVANDPIPFFSKPTYFKRPGIVSIVQSYATFPILDLVRNPILPYDEEGSYPAHRTSLWAQLYGRAHSVHFDGWPPTWRSTNPVVVNLTRVIFLLALVPSFLFLVGAVKALPLLGRTRSLPDPDGYAWMLLLGVPAYLAFTIEYTMVQRDFSCMKVIFTYPGLLGFLYLFVKGLDGAHVRIAPHARLSRLFDLSFILLLLAYCLDVVYLIGHLVDRHL